MRALCWKGKNRLAVEEVPDPQILTPRDAIVKISSTAICGSDLHLYNGFVPTMKRGDILGHEFMGEIVEVGSDVGNLRPGDRVVVPFPIACGACRPCQAGQTSICENSNPNAGMAEKMFGHSPSGIFGYSHMLGGYAGGQAEFARVPFADVGPLKVDNDLPDDALVMLADVFPTAWMGAEMADIRPGDIVAIWGAGPVGLLAAASALLLGAGRVIVIDRFEYRLAKAREAGAETLNYEAVSVLEALNEMTGGRGPDACIDAVGMEAHHHVGPVHAYDRAKQSVKAETDRPHALREAIYACRNGGTISIVGVYGGAIDKFPIGAAMNRSLTFKMGQCHVHKYMRPLLERMERGEIDPAFIVSHRLGLDQAAEGYKKFRDKEDDCTKIVLKTHRLS